MDEQKIRELIRQMDTSKPRDAEAAWSQIPDIGEDIVPYLVEFYPTARKWQGRVAAVYYSMKYAHMNEAAFQLGVAACSDKATLVRCRACELLACSLRNDALPVLKKLLTHPDKRTTEDAAAAIDSIEHRNPNYFIDREHTGRIFLSVGGTAEDAIRNNKRAGVFSRIGHYVRTIFRKT